MKYSEQENQSFPINVNQECEDGEVETDESAEHELKAKTKNINQS